jgi:plasmid stabilization system protein ParE
MDCKVNWTDDAWTSFEENIDYLIAQWTDKEVSNFVVTAEHKIRLLKKHPKLGSPKNKKQLNVRYMVIHKRIVLVYKHKPLKNEIDLLLFWNTTQHPRKLKVR